MRKTVRSRLGVSVITCTNRPFYFGKVIGNFRRQRYKPKELIVVLNRSSMNLSRYRRKVSKYRNISVFKRPSRFSLGRCLNDGIAKSRYPIIAKFDDDDYYSPAYLREQVRALKRTGAGIVGKASHLKYFEGKRLLVMMAPSLRNRYVRHVAGGTLMFRRKLHRRIRFATLTVGEDVNFIRRTMARGHRVYATSPYHFVGIRRKNKRSHTWKASDRAVMRGSVILARTGNYRRWADRAPKYFRS